MTMNREPSMNAGEPELRHKFERLGYFALVLDTGPRKPVFNRTITLKDTWAKEAQKG